jgi:AraC-like DNA-binding protein
MRPELDISELAGAAQLSVYHFMRSFRAAKGLTAHQYVVQLRLREACNFLARGMSASEVANSVGFADQSHLIRHFRAAYGVTPGSFAKESRRRFT